MAGADSYHQIALSAFRALNRDKRRFAYRNAVERVTPAVKTYTRYVGSPLHHFLEIEPGLALERYSTCTA
jgi:hypothetical protein